MKSLSRLLLLLLASITIVVDAHARVTSAIFNDDYILVNETYNLKGKTIQLKDGAVLDFRGGKIANGTIIGNNTVIIAGRNPIFDNVKIEGTWNIDEAYPEWLGGKGDDKTDCSSAITNTLKLSPNTLKFTNGVYCITTPIVTNNPDVVITHNATIKAIEPMDVVILGDFPDKGIYNLRKNFLINGGGTIDANGKAKVGIALRKAHHAVISQLTVKNATEYGFKAAVNTKEAGNSLLREMIFMNEMSIPNAVGILNNRSDCTYEHISIVNYKIGVECRSQNAKFTDVHPWLINPEFWEESVAFDCYCPHVTLISSEADTMRKLIRCHEDYFFATVINCAAYKNDVVVSDGLATKYKPLVIDKNGYKNSKLTVIGGVYWFSVPYDICPNIEESDTFTINRYNSKMTNYKNK